MSFPSAVATSHLFHHGHSEIAEQLPKIILNPFYNSSLSFATSNWVTPPLTFWLTLLSKHFSNLASYVLYNNISFHTPRWWQQHWQHRGAVVVERADLLPHGWERWMQGMFALAKAGNTRGVAEPRCCASMPAGIWALSELWLAASRKQGKRDPSGYIKILLS